MTRKIQTHRTSSGGTFEFARMLRKDMTTAETALWERLRKKALDGFRFRRQHPIGPYIVDFFCSEAGIAIEVDGKIHLAAAQRERDRLRHLALTDHGVRILRFTNEQIENEIDVVLAAILRELKSAMISRDEFLR